MSEAQDAIEAQRREKFRQFAQREENLKHQVRELEYELSQLSRAVFRFLDHPACQRNGLLVDLVEAEGDVPLGVWWSDRQDTPTVHDLARLIEASREVE